MRFFVFLLSLSTIYCLPSTPAAHAETVDIGFLGQESISFSTSELIAGTRARVYARIHNFGDIDVTGRVAFHQGTIPLGSSQPISVRAGGAYEEVFVDFTVPEAEFNIRAQIVDTDPAETVTDNNIVLSTMFEPIEDEDQDGVIDDEDNCPSTENPDQQDADGDGKGNVCDEDDDNDSLSDEVEEELGSDPEATDTDGDGVDDGDDATPTVFNEAEETEEEESAQGSTEQELVTQQAVAEEEPNETTTSEPTETESTTEEGTDGTKVTEVTEDLVVEEGAEEVQTVAVERETAFTVSSESWNTYEFSVPAGTPSDATIVWSFGDGSTSSKSTVAHTFREPGSYDVTLTITRSGETLLNETETIRVSFFHFENPSVKLVLSILLVLLILGLSVVFRLRKLSMPSL